MANFGCGDSNPTGRIGQSNDANQGLITPEILNHILAETDGMAADYRRRVASNNQPEVENSRDGKYEHFVTPDGRQEFIFNNCTFNNCNFGAGTKDGDYRYGTGPDLRPPQIYSQLNNPQVEYQGEIISPMQIINPRGYTDYSGRYHRLPQGSYDSNEQFHPSQLNPQSEYYLRQANNPARIEDPQGYVDASGTYHRLPKGYFDSNEQFHCTQNSEYQYSQNYNQNPEYNTQGRVYQPRGYYDSNGRYYPTVGNQNLYNQPQQPSEASRIGATVSHFLGGMLNGAVNPGYGGYGYGGGAGGIGSILGSLLNRHRYNNGYNSAYIYPQYYAPQPQYYPPSYYSQNEQPNYGLNYLNSELAREYYASQNNNGPVVDYSDN